ncbi:MAG: DUF1559 domain-containing protein [Planctomyces sp.]|nr:DUF1559 domain-containing protein [Planctomyces sp.]
MRAETAVFIPFVLQTQDSRTVCAQLTPEFLKIARQHSRCSPYSSPTATKPRHRPRPNAPQTPTPPNLLPFNRGQTRCSASFLTFHHYDHIMVPNSYGSHNGPEDHLLQTYDYVKMIPPSSLHASGVNCLRADGSVDFVNDSIDIIVWRDLGTRAGPNAN